MTYVASPLTPRRQMLTYLEFEKPIAALDQRIAELRDTATSGDIDIEPEIAISAMESAGSWHG